MISWHSSICLRGKGWDGMGGGQRWGQEPGTTPGPREELQAFLQLVSWHWHRHPVWERARTAAAKSGQPCQPIINLIGNHNPESKQLRKLIRILSWGPDELNKRWNINLNCAMVPAAHLEVVATRPAVANLWPRGLNFQGPPLNQWFDRLSLVLKEYHLWIPKKIGSTTLKLQLKKN